MTTRCVFSFFFFQSIIIAKTFILKVLIKSFYTYSTFIKFTIFTHFERVYEASNDRETDFCFRCDVNSRLYERRKIAVRVFRVIITNGTLRVIAGKMRVFVRSARFVR